MSKVKTIYELQHNKTNKVACKPREDSDQPGHMHNLTRVFAVHLKGSQVKLYTVDSRHLEIEGTFKNSSRYPYFDISDL